MIDEGKTLGISWVYLLFSVVLTVEASAVYFWKRLESLQRTV